MSEPILQTPEQLEEILRKNTVMIGGEKIPNDGVRAKLLSHIKAQDAALQKINEIRNSIVGTQTMNWSAHLYPLVAALKEAGLEGESFVEARGKARTLIQQRDEALRERDELARWIAGTDATYPHGHPIHIKAQSYIHDETAEGVLRDLKTKKEETDGT